MRLTHLLQALWGRRRLFLIVIGTVVLLGVAVSALSPKKYAAVATLVADVISTDPVSGAQLPSQLTTSYLATQADVIASRNVALRVVDRFRLTQAQAFGEQFRKIGNGTESLREWAAEQLLRNVAVIPSRESSVISIQFSAPDPALAAEIANAFASAYIETTLDLKMDPARRQTGWFDEQLQDLRKTLQATQQRLSEYQQQNGLVGADDRLDVENARLADLGNELVAAQAAMYAAESRQKQMLQAVKEGQLQQMPDVLGNSLLQTMKADLVRAEGKFAEIAQRFGRNHPQYIGAAAEVRILKDRLAAELETAKGSVIQSAQLAEHGAAEVQHAVDAQKLRILSLKQQRDGLDVLVRDVENAQRTYEAVSQRASQVRLGSLLNQSSIAVLSAAVAPLRASSPNIPLNVIMSILIGGMLGIGAVLLAELLDKRVRSGADIIDVSGLTILGELPPRLAGPVERPGIARLISLLQGPQARSA